MPVRMPLDPRLRGIIERYLKGEELDPRAHIRLHKLRKRLSGVDFDRMRADVELLERFIRTRRKPPRGARGEEAKCEG